MILLAFWSGLLNELIELFYYSMRISWIFLTNLSVALKHSLVGSVLT